MTTTYEEVLGFIALEATTDQLTVIKDRASRAFDAKARAMPVGTAVIITNIRPKYLDGLTGKVAGTDHRTGKILVTPDIPQPRFRSPFALQPEQVVPA
jgi:hypothetical protein